MRVDVIMPQMGESIQEGTLTKWLKKVGESVKRDEPLFEISTDKVDAEIPAPAAGTLAEMKVEEGATVPINTLVGVIETEAAGAVATPAGSTPSAARAEHAPAAARIEAAKPEAAATSSPVPAQGGAGQPARPAAVAQGSPPAPARSGAAQPSSRLVVPFPSKPRSEMTPEELRRTRSSPVVRKIASEHGVDITALSGTGIAGRVTKKDILAAVESGVFSATRPGPAPPGSGGFPAVSVPASLPGERFERVPMTVMRKKIAEHMVLSRRISAHVTTVFEIDYSGIDSIRKEKGSAFLQRHGVKLTYLPFIARALVDSLRAFPSLNASIDGENVLYKKDINLGIAVALEWGLIVPVVKNAEDLSLSGLAKAIAALAEKARTKKLTPNDVAGGTFTITNPGIFGGLFGTPIINQPQVAILGVGTIEKRPVVINDAIAIHSMGYLALSFDHRLIDGAVADQFMADLKGRLSGFDGAQV